MIEAFSRSRKPTLPISWLREMAMSGTASRRISAARSSISGVTGEKTEVMAAVFRPRSRTVAATSINPFSSRGAMVRPSNSCPPRSMKVWRPSVSAKSFGQSVSGGRPLVAGRPRRMAATSSRRLRSTTALVKWVVPIITA